MLKAHTNTYKIPAILCKEESLKEKQILYRKSKVIKTSMQVTEPLKFLFYSRIPWYMMFSISGRLYQVHLLILPGKRME